MDLDQPRLLRECHAQHMAGWGIDEIEVSLPQLPFAELPSVSRNDRLRMEQDARQRNARYVAAILEHRAFCTKIKQKRALEKRHVDVHYALGRNIGPLFDQMWMAMERPNVVITHVVFPAAEVEWRAFSRFCKALTEAGHALRGAPSTLDVTALHPHLPWGDTPKAARRLFRRSPQPTLQWVRRDALDAEPSYDRRRDPSNAEARRLGYERLAARLEAIRDEILPQLHLVRA